MFREHLEQEVMAFYDVVQPAIRHLRVNRGSIVAVTSAGGRRHPARDALSVAPKGTVEALVRALAVEEGRFGVRANCVGPGMLTDGMAVRLRESGDLDDAALDAARRNIPMRTFGTAVDLAEAVCFFASPRAGLRHRPGDRRRRWLRRLVRQSSLSATALGVTFIFGS